MDPNTEYRPGHQRTRSRGMSFKSEKSAASSHKNKIKIDNLRESAEDKRRNHLTLGTKANPNAAMNEAQPIAAALEESTLPSLRATQQVDANGVPISEPDRSNPTRPRWERPLDTIRSFEKAIDNEYRQRQGFTRQDTGNGFESRRSSYYGGYGDNQQSRYSQVSHFYNGGGRNRESFNEYGEPPRAHPPRSRFSHRVHSDLALNRYSTATGGNNGGGMNNGYPPPSNQPYPNHSYQQSRDTVNTGASGGSTSEPWTNNTDPSSENSSVDRMNYLPRSMSYPDVAEQQYMGGIKENGEYAYTQPPRSRGRPLDGNVFSNNNGHYGSPPPVPPHATQLRSNGMQQQERPPPPPKQLNGGPGTFPAPMNRVPVAAGGAQVLRKTSGNDRPPLQQSDSKRKSWFKRRFSKD